MVKIIGFPLLFAIALSSCVSSGNFCDISEPMRLSPEAIGALSDDEVGRVLAHNEKGEELCGWKP